MAKKYLLFLAIVRWQSFCKMLYWFYISRDIVELIDVIYQEVNLTNTTPCIHGDDFRWHNVWICIRETQYKYLTSIFSISVDGAKVKPDFFRSPSSIHFLSVNLIRCLRSWNEMYVNWKMAASTLTSPKDTKENEVAWWLGEMVDAKRWLVNDQCGAKCVTLRITLHGRAEWFY